MRAANRSQRAVSGGRSGVGPVKRQARRARTSNSINIPIDLCQMNSSSLVGDRLQPTAAKPRPSCRRIKQATSQCRTQQVASGWFSTGKFIITGISGPFSKKEDAEKFKTEHKGNKVVTYSEVKADDVKPKKKMLKMKHDEGSGHKMKH